MQMLQRAKLQGFYARVIVLFFVMGVGFFPMGVAVAQNEEPGTPTALPTLEETLTETPQVTDTPDIAATETPLPDETEVIVETQVETPVNITTTDLPVVTETTVPIPAVPGETTPGEIVQPQVVGGYEAVPGAWPWIVALVHSGAPDFYFGQFCAGILIDANWVMTAAHCLVGETPSTFDVVAGIHDLQTPAPGYQMRDVSTFIIHPGYNSYTVVNDIALILLASPVVPGGDGATRVATIPPAYKKIGTLAGRTTLLAGWGSMVGNSGPWPYQLQQVYLPVYSNSVCSNSSHWGRSVPTSKLCAGSDYAWIGACFGDSGGPLAIQYGTGWQVVGIVSYGKTYAGYCGFLPDVYTRVSSFSDWIYGITGVTSAPPTLSKVTPGRTTSVMVPFTITLKGKNIAKRSQVYWNGTPVPTTYLSATALQAAIPANPSGVYRAVIQNLYTGTFSSARTVTIRNPKPVISGISQSTAIVYDSALSLTVTGGSFVSNSYVSWNRIRLVTEYVSATQLKAQIPANLFLKAGKNSISVVNPKPGGGKSRLLPFFVNNPVPQLTSANPLDLHVRVAASMALYGNNFVPKTSVYWNGRRIRTRFISRTVLVVSVTSSMVKVPGVATLYVVNPRPGGGRSGSITANILSP